LTVNKKWKSAYDTIGRCLSYLRAEVNPDRGIVVVFATENSTEKDQWGMEKYDVLHFSGNNL